MNQKDIFVSRRDERPNFATHLNQTSQPPLNLSKIELKRWIVGDQELELLIDEGVVGILQLLYKGKAGGALSLTETEDRSSWGIARIQGGRGKPAYRIASGLRWDALLVEELERCAKTVGADVRRICMPPFREIPYLGDAASEDIENRYARARLALGMRWSDDEQKFIVDLQK